MTAKTIQILLDDTLPDELPCRDMPAVEEATLTGFDILAELLSRVRKCRV